MINFPLINWLSISLLGPKLHTVPSHKTQILIKSLLAHQLLRERQPVIDEGEATIDGWDEHESQLLRESF